MSMKKILFGIALILFSIFALELDKGSELPGIVEYIYVFAPLIGLVFCFIGLFSKEPKEDLIEEIRSILLDQKRSEEKKLVCKKWAQEYKEGYSSCPWCGYKEN